MLREEAVSIIQTRLGFRPSASKESEIIDELQNAQFELEQEDFLPWFLLSEMSTATCTANEERLALPLSFLREAEDSHFWLYDASNSDDPWKEMVKDSYGALKAALKGTGEPTKYSIRGQYITLHKTPNDAYTFKFLYYKKDEVLDANIENKWLKNAPYVLIAKAGLEMAESLKNSAAWARFDKMYARAYARLQNDPLAREQANLDLAMGDD